MKLIRGWESCYTPDVTGGLRLSKASVYRSIGEEEGIGDRREGEVRMSDVGEVTVNWEGDLPFRITDDIGARADAEFAEQMRAHLAAQFDDPEVSVEKVGGGDGGDERWKVSQNLKLDDSPVDSPFLLCFSREPATRSEWEKLRTSLPSRLDTWTATEVEDLESLDFEIECGFKRWLELHEAKSHRLWSARDWVTYYDTIPPSVESDQLGEVVPLARWFQKRKQYRNHAEYRLAWLWESPQWAGLKLQETADIELTKTGLELFKPWEPPDC